MSSATECAPQTYVYNVWCDRKDARPVLEADRGWLRHLP